MCAQNAASAEEKTAVAASAAAVVGVVSGDCGKWFSCVYCRANGRHGVGKFADGKQLMKQQSSLLQPSTRVNSNCVPFSLCTYIINVLVGKRPHPQSGGKGGGTRPVCCNNKSRVVFQTHMTETNREAKVQQQVGEVLIKLETHFPKPVGILIDVAVSEPAESPFVG